MPRWRAMKLKSRSTPLSFRDSTNRPRMLLMRSRMAATSCSHCAAQVLVVQHRADDGAAVAGRVGVVGAHHGLDVAERGFRLLACGADERHGAHALVVQAEVLGIGTGDDQFVARLRQTQPALGVLAEAAGKALVGEIDQGQDAHVGHELRDDVPLLRSQVDARRVVATAVQHKHIARRHARHGGGHALEVERIRCRVEIGIGLDRQTRRCEDARVVGPRGIADPDGRIRRWSWR